MTFLGNKGFSLVEILISMAALGALVLTTGAVTRLTGKNTNFVRISGDLLNMVGELDNALRPHRVCEHNFKGRIYTPNDPPDVEQITYTRGQEIIGEGMKYSNVLVEIEGINLVEKSYIKRQSGNDMAIVELRVNTQNAVNAVGSQRQVRNVNLYMGIRNKRVVTCSTSPDLISETDDHNNDICVIGSNGSLKFDPIAGRCVSAVKKRCFRGSSSKAFCPKQYKQGLSCAAKPPGGFSDTDEYKTDRVYITNRGDRVIGAGPPPYIATPRFRPGKEQSCECAYAKDLDGGGDGWKCQICCEIEV